MAPSTRDRISVDLGGLRAALLAHASARGITPSDLVRAALAESLGHTKLREHRSGANELRSVSTKRVRISLRVGADQAHALASAAKAAGLPKGEFVAGLVAGVPVLSTGANRAEHLAALVESSAEISTFSRNIDHLTSLLREGAFRSAQEYRPMLDTLGAAVRAHLTLTARVLAELQPHRVKRDEPHVPSA